MSPGRELPHGSRALPVLAACSSQLCTAGAALTQAVTGNHPPMGAIPVVVLEGTTARAGRTPSSITACTDSDRERQRCHWGRQAWGHDPAQGAK